MGCKTLMFLMALAVAPIVRADGPGRIYTKPLEADTGTITGKVNGAVLTHAIAVERDRTRAYLAVLDAGGAGFRFEKLPVGRFDLVLVTTDNRVIEGANLGEETKLPDERAAHLDAGIAKADSFFNRRITHRAGVADGVALVFVERIRDGEILRGSGEKINACLRRLEIIELHEADDEWQMVRTRHLYREETPPVKGIPFLTHQHLPSLCGIRVASAPRDLGTIDLTKH
jgi:acyl dehydratase